MSPPQWAYQVENFVTKPDDELVCSVCHAIFCEPVICPCDHVFCKACITKWLQNNRNCPICRKRVTRYSIKQMVPIVKNLIMKLVLNCRNKEHGCEVQFNLESCENHMKECSFELVQCKNKPCKEKVFRRDVEEHETNGCPHRYVKCKTCGSKMSTSTPPQDHNCVRALQLRLRKKCIMIRKKNSRIKELRNEIKTLKETSQGSAGSAETSWSNSSLSPDDIMFNIGEFESFSSVQTDESSSSDVSTDRSIIAIFANSEPDHYSDGNQSDDSFADFLLENMNTGNDHQNDSTLDLNEFRNAESQTIDDLSVLGNQRDSNRNDSSVENDNPRVEVRITSVSDEELSQPRRPAKRRHPPPNASASDDENDLGEQSSLSSSKRCWRVPATENQDASPENNAADSSNSYTEAGPSQEPLFTAVNYTAPSEEEEDGTSSNTKRQFRLRSRRNQKHSVAAKPTVGSSPQQSNGVFERTLSLLAQYNLESDPEWLPEHASHRGNDTTTDSDSSSEEDILSDSSSSTHSEDSRAANLLNELYGSSSEDDPDWRPI